MRKLPENAFAFYLALGPARSHQAVGDHYGCSKKAVTNKAITKNWKGKLAEYEREQSRLAEKRAAESLEAMNERQLKVLSYIQGKAIETLKTVPMDTAMEAVRAYTMAVQQERLIRGQPSQRATIDLEKKILAEHENWTTPVEGSEEPDEDETPEEPAVPPSDAPGDPEPPAVAV